MPVSIWVATSSLEQQMLCLRFCSSKQRERERVEMAKLSSVVQAKAGTVISVKGRSCRFACIPGAKAGAIQPLSRTVPVLLNLLLFTCPTLTQLKGCHSFDNYPITLFINLTTVSVSALSLYNIIPASVKSQA